MTNKEIIEKLDKEIQEDGEAQIEPFEEYMLQFSKEDVLDYCKKTLSLKEAEVLKIIEDESPYNYRHTESIKRFKEIITQKIKNEKNRTTI